MNNCRHYCTICLDRTAFNWVPGCACDLLQHKCVLKTVTATTTKEISCRVLNKLELVYILFDDCDIVLLSNQKRREWRGERAEWGDGEGGGYSIPSGFHYRLLFVTINGLQYTVMLDGSFSSEVVLQVQWKKKRRYTSVHSVEVAHWRNRASINFRWVDQKWWL